MTYTRLLDIIRLKIGIDMKKNRSFVTNFYFYDAGISRQVLKAARDRGEIVPAGTVQNFKVYQVEEADLFILKFHLRNPNMFFESFSEQVNQQFIRFEDASSVGLLITPKGAYEDYENIPDEYFKVCSVILKYCTFYFQISGRWDDYSIKTVSYTHLRAHET